jgi:hypothetical protein
MTVATMNVAGNPTPLPLAMPSGTTPPITPRGAAAATTMNTMDATPRVPRSLRVVGSDAKESGVSINSDMVAP